jgi:hypothetical protein
MRRDGSRTCPSCSRSGTSSPRSSRGKVPPAPGQTTKHRHRAGASRGRRATPSDASSSAAPLAPLERPRLTPRRSIVLSTLPRPSRSPACRRLKQTTHYAPPLLLLLLLRCSLWRAAGASNTTAHYALPVLLLLLLRSAAPLLAPEKGLAALSLPSVLQQMQTRQARERSSRLVSPSSAEAAPIMLCFDAWPASGRASAQRFA